MVFWTQASFWEAGSDEWQVDLSPSTNLVPEHARVAADARAMTAMSGGAALSVTSNSGGAALSVTSSGGAALLVTSNSGGAAFVSNICVDVAALWNFWNVSDSADGDCGVNKYEALSTSVQLWLCWLYKSILWKCKSWLPTQSWSASYVALALSA